MFDARNISISKHQAFRHTGLWADRTGRQSATMAPDHPDRDTSYSVAAAILCGEAIPRGRTPSSPCFLSSGGPANRRKASAICARLLTPVINTSTMVKEAWKRPRALSCSTPTPAAASLAVGDDLVTQRIKRASPHRRRGPGYRACREVGRRADRCDRPASRRDSRTRPSATESQAPIPPPASPAAPGTSARPAARTTLSGQRLAPRIPRPPARPGCRHSRWS